MQVIHDAFPHLERDLRFFPLGVAAPKTLSIAQIEQYNERGYVAPIDVFDADEIGAIREYFDDLLPKALAAGWNSYELTNWHMHCRGVWDIVTQSKILDLVQDLVGDTIVLRHSHFFTKLPGDGKRVSWHQDASYWPITPSKVVSVWLAVDHVDEENAAMQVIPRSHLQTKIPFHESAAEERNVLNQTVPNPEEFGDAPVPLVLEAGQASLHSDWILHGSEVNHSTRRRCGLAMRFLAGDVRAYEGWNSNSIICRGEEPTGHWADHPRPAGEDIPVKADAAELQSHSWTTARR